MFSNLQLKLFGTLSYLLGTHFIFVCINKSVIIESYKNTVDYLIESCPCLLAVIIRLTLRAGSIKKGVFHIKL